MIPCIIAVTSVDAVQACKARRNTGCVGRGTLARSVAAGGTLGSLPAAARPRGCRPRARAAGPGYARRYGKSSAGRYERARARRQWTKPELFKRWWVPKSMGISLLSCDMDVRAGGKYRLVFGSDASSSMEFFGSYIE
jgi:hypothetical protein